MSLPQVPCYPLPTNAPDSKLQWPLVPKRAVLLIHDMQDYFLRCYDPEGALRQTLLAHISALRDWAHAQGVPVVYTAQPTEQSPADRALLNDLWGPGLTSADPALAQVAAAIAPTPQDLVLTKWRYSAFQRSDLQAQMQSWGRDQLVIVGIYAHIGCLMTAVDAFMRDIQPFMVSDALADFSAEEHAMALRYVAGRAGRVLNTQQVLGTPTGLDWARFKAAVLAQLPEAPAELSDDDNLLDHGLDSVQLMELIATWSQLGKRVRFEDLAATPSLAAWWKVLEAATA